MKHVAETANADGALAKELDPDALAQAIDERCSADRAL
jgi:hypothetical protein